MTLLLDTDIAIHLRDADRSVISALQATRQRLTISVITRVELEGGVHRDPAQAARRRARMDIILKRMMTLAFDENAARRYGDIVAALGYSRRKLLDRMIAAQALVHGLTLVTRNDSDFRTIPGLKLTTL